MSGTPGTRIKAKSGIAEFFGGNANTSHQQKSKHPNASPSSSQPLVQQTVDSSSSAKLKKSNIPMFWQRGRKTEEVVPAPAPTPPKPKPTRPPPIVPPPLSAVPRASRGSSASSPKSSGWALLFLTLNLSRVVLALSGLIDLKVPESLCGGFWWWHDQEVPWDIERIFDQAGFWYRS